MSALWNLSLVPFTDANGDPRAGAKAYFFDTGTTTPRTAYSDSALSVAHDHPVVADANGVFPAVFIQQGQYRSRVDTSDDVVLHDVDGITAPVTNQTVEGGGATEATLLFQTGMMVMAFQTGTLAGFVRANGRTIGNAGSGATERANDDTEDLFTQFWAEAKISVVGDKGASAASDWTAGKQLTLPDFRARAPTGMSGMGNTAVSLISDANVDSSDTADVLAATAGAEDHTLTVDEMPSHNHSGLTGQQAQTLTNVSSGNHNVEAGATQQTANSVTSTVTADAHTHTISSQGGGSAHPIIQPSIFVPFYIKL